MDSAVLHILGTPPHNSGGDSADQARVVLSQVPQGLVDGTAKESIIVLYLSNTSYPTAWNESIHVLEHSRESKYDHNEFTAARNKARPLLDLGVEAIRLLEILREDLRHFEMMLPGIEARLTSLSLFKEIATSPSESEERDGRAPKIHEFGSKLEVWRSHITTRPGSSMKSTISDNVSIVCSIVAVNEY